MTWRWRSASARIFSDSAAPSERNSLATRRRSDSIRAIHRTGDVGRQLDAAQAHVDDFDADRLARRRRPSAASSAVIRSRSVEIASCIVRLLNSSARFARTVCDRRRRAASSSPCTET